MNKNQNVIMTCEEFAKLADYIGITTPKLAELLDRKPSTISHYRTTATPPPDICKKLRRLVNLLTDFKLNG